MPTATCATCGAEFAQSAARTRYCRQACYLANIRQRAAESLITRFWAKVQKTPTCWLWTANAVRGYGQYHLPRTGRQQHVIYAHRFSWTLTNGPIPDNLAVLHRCDVPLCVNPNHLFLGTLADNLADARAKGRLIDGKHLIKVSDAGIRDIQRRYVPRKNGKQLAAEYGIHLVSLLRIVAGTQRKNQRIQTPPVFERVPHVDLPVLGEVR